jgi:hypothetical protein
MLNHDSIEPRRVRREAGTHFRGGVRSARPGRHAPAA